MTWRAVPAGICFECKTVSCWGHECFFERVCVKVLKIDGDEQRSSNECVCVCVCLGVCACARVCQGVNHTMERKYFLVPERSAHLIALSLTHIQTHT